MSLRWDWNDKMGEVEYDRITGSYKCNIYQGNALMIIIYEDEKDNTYTLLNFYVDEAHLKNCLGLTKGYNDNILENRGITKLRLNTKYKSVSKIISLLAKSKMPINIELYYEE